jgi:hypothetical protein
MSTTPVIMTDFTSSIEFDFDMNGNVVAVLSNTETMIQDPVTKATIATSVERGSMPLAQAQQIIANAQQAPASSVQMASTLIAKIN